jgi:hypothetical protein
LQRPFARNYRETEAEMEVPRIALAKCQKAAFNRYGLFAVRTRPKKARLMGQARKFIDKGIGYA